MRYRPLSKTPGEAVNLVVPDQYILCGSGCGVEALTGERAGPGIQPRNAAHGLLQLEEGIRAGRGRGDLRRYGEELERNLQDLADRLKRGAYRAKPIGRVYIPKADGRRPRC